MRETRKPVGLSVKIVRPDVRINSPRHVFIYAFKF